jgi:hypothetical protein
MPSTQTTPSVGEMLGEAFSLMCFMAIYGPPVVFLVAPWLLLGLLLSGPFALLATFALVAAALFAGIAAIVAAPYLVVRGLRAVGVSIATAPVALRRVAA